MPPAEAIEIIKLIESEGMQVWVDGGWGVDALLGRPTRVHQDLDLAVKLSDTARIHEILLGLGYSVHEDEMPTRLEMRDPHDHRVDLHPLMFDENGNGVQQLQDGNVGIYTAEGLRGRGSIDGVPVRCLSPALQLRFHEGYEPAETDRHDVRLLVAEFGLELPLGYA